MIKIKSKYGATWELIFFHNSSNYEYFETEEAYFCNETNKFSIIGLIDDSFRYNGYYEYLLEYP